MKSALVLFVSLLHVCVVHAAATGDPTRGETLYEARCAGCHSLDDNRVGPKHRGVFGRRAGTVSDFEYSPAVKRSNVVWDERMLDRWLTDPGRLIPGQKMGYQVGEPADRADLIAYLRRESAK